MELSISYVMLGCMGFDNLSDLEVTQTSTIGDEYAELQHVACVCWLS